MQANFELAKAFEANLEQIPRLKPEFHFELNDIAKKILEVGELSLEDSNLLSSVWTELQGLDPDLVMLLDEYRSKGVLSAQEALLCGDCFLATYQTGPEVKELRDIFYTISVNGHDFSDVIKQSQIPEYSQGVLLDVYNKMKDFR